MATTRTSPPFGPTTVQSLNFPGSRKTFPSALTPEGIADPTRAIKRKMPVKRDLVVDLLIIVVLLRPTESSRKDRYAFWMMKPIRTFVPKRRTKVNARESQKA